MADISRNFASSAILSTIGLLTVSNVIFKILSLARTYTYSSKLSRYAHPSRDGEPPWALVTGASDGIGLALAHELAANGFNVVLHGRNREKLSRVESELRDAFPQRSFRILVADAHVVPCVNCLTASENGRQDGSAALDFAAIKQELDGLNLTVVVNNAGGNPIGPIFVPLKDKTEDRTIENVSLNALFPLHLARTLLPNLIQNSPSLLINIGSMSDRGLPLIATYAASKQFLMTLTGALRLEIAMEGKANDVEVLGIRAGRVTGVSRYKELPSLFSPSTETFAKAALAHAGNGGGVVIGYWAHALQQLVTDSLPGWVLDKVMINVMHQEREWDLKAKKDS
ncbi:NAD(P)-binding protein [Daldinia sp. FL1419]|nr:NAD(P)-binding protein [Daldinia sp. FL1419]